MPCRRARPTSRPLLTARMQEPWFVPVSSATIPDAFSVKLWERSCLQFERRHGYVRPRRFLPSGHECIIKDLGECGDRKCGNYRLGKYSAVRPDFLKFCVEHIKTCCSKAGLVYCSLGSGQLLFDWELLEHLIQKEGVHVRAIHLIDIAYGGAKPSCKRSAGTAAFRRVVPGGCMGPGPTSQSGTLPYSQLSDSKRFPELGSTDW